MTIPKPSEKDYRDFAKHTQSFHTRKHLLGVAAPHLEIKIDQLDQDPFLLNVKNGTIDLKTGQLRPHRAGDFLTKLAPVIFDPGARCDLFMAFLNRIFNGDPELIEFIQRAVGYALSGSVSEQVWFLLYGSGANGKSTLMELLVAGLGDYALAAPPGLLLKKTHASHPTELADLFGARLVATAEVKADSSWDEERIKSLSGGDKVKGRHMREDFWSFTPTHKIFISANHRPATGDSSLGFWRRVRMVPFTTTIPEAERDPNLLEKLKAELPGVLAWAVRGCLEWQRQGLGSAAAVDQATAEYRTESDSVSTFLSECCDRRADLAVQSITLFNAFRTWASSRREPDCSHKAFSARLRDLGYTPVKQSAMVFKGLGLKEQDEDPTWTGSPDSEFTL